MIEKLKELEKESTPGPWMANILAGRFCVIPSRTEIASSFDFDLIDEMRKALPKFLALYDAAKLAVEDNNLKHEDFGGNLEMLETAIKALEQE